MMKRAAIVAGVLAIAASPWVWQSETKRQVCDEFQVMVLETTSGGSATIEDALERFGVQPTDDASPKFGATINRRSPQSREFYIWKEGVVVQSVSLHHYPGGWGVTGHSECSELGARFK